MNDADKGITINVGTVDGGVQPNVIAPHSSLPSSTFACRPIEDGERVEMRRFIQHEARRRMGVRLRVEGAIGRPSMEATPRNQAFWQQASRRSGRRARPRTRLELRAGGGSDGNTTSQYTATLDGLGPVGDGAHARPRVPLHRQDPGACSAVDHGCCWLAADRCFSRLSRGWPYESATCPRFPHTHQPILRQEPFRTFERLERTVLWETPATTFLGRDRSPGERSFTCTWRSPDRGFMLPGQSPVIILSVRSGISAATLEGAGSYPRRRSTTRLHAMTNAGLFGRFTSFSPYCCRTRFHCAISAMQRPGMATKLTMKPVRARRRRWCGFRLTRRF